MSSTLATSTAAGVLTALLNTSTGVSLSGLGITPTPPIYPAPPQAVLIADALVFTGVQKGGREGGQQSMTTNTWTTDNSKWDRLESYLITGQAIGMYAFTSNETTQANTARGDAYLIAGAVEQWVRLNRTAAGALEIEMEKMELQLANATISTTNYKVATVTFGIRVHALI